MLLHELYYLYLEHGFQGLKDHPAECKELCERWPLEIWQKYQLRVSEMTPFQMAKYVELFFQETRENSNPRMDGPGTQEQTAESLIAIECGDDPDQDRMEELGYAAAERFRRIELLEYSTSRLWDVVYAKLNRSGRPADDATREDVVRWILDFEYRGLHKMDWPPKEETNDDQYDPGT